MPLSPIRRLAQLSRQLSTPTITRAMSSIPQTQRALRIEKTGGLEVLNVQEDAPVPKPKENEVLIKTTWAGVNFIDTYQRSGLYQLPLPLTLGQESAGTVAVAPASGRFKVGQRVAAYSGGAFAEYHAAPENKVVALPDDLSDKDAATVLLQGLTAWTLLKEAYEVKPGDWVLVHAVAGGVGLLLAQMAKHIGAHVIGTTSTEEKAALAKQNGAEHVILYTKESVVDRVNEITKGDGVHVVYDGVGKDTWEDDFLIARRKGSIITFGNASGAVPPFAPLKLAGKNLKVARPTLGNYVATAEELDRYAAELFDLVAKGTVKLRVHDEYPLSTQGIRKAQEDISGRGTTGKLIVNTARKE